MARILVLGDFSESRMHAQGALLGRLVEGGHRLTVAGPGPSTGVDAIDDNRSIQQQEVPLRGVDADRIRDLEAMWHLHRLLRQETPELFIAYTVRDLVYGLLAGWLADVPLRPVLLTGLKTAPSEPEATRRYLLQKGASMLYRASRSAGGRVVFQNRDDAYLFCARRLVGEPGQVVMVDGRSVDVEAYRPVPLADGAKFIFVGRLATRRGVVEYVQAARRIRRHHPRARFQLIGWPDSSDETVDRRQLQSWIGEEAIEYLGRFDDIRPVLEDNSIYVSPPHRTGTPGTVLEAMAMGRPLVTTDIAGCRELVEYGENGYCVEPGDVESLARAMTHFIGESELRETMGSKSRRLVVERFDVDNVADSLLKALELDTESVPPPLPSDVR